MFYEQKRIFQSPIEQRANIYLCQQLLVGKYFVITYLGNYGDSERETSEYVVSNYNLSFDTKIGEFGELRKNRNPGL